MPIRRNPPGPRGGIGRGPNPPDLSVALAVVPILPGPLVALAAAPTPPDLSVASAAVPILPALSAALVLDVATNPDCCASTATAFAVDHNNK